MSLTFGSLFAGIGGFDAGLEAAGAECVFQAERDKDCNRILSRHWPRVERHSDVREFSKAATSFRPDLICGGFPCQDLSVAGRRAGLSGERSGLWYEFKRIIGEFLPAWVLIENVPGLLSSWSEHPDAPSGIPRGAELGRRIVLDETSDFDAVTRGLAELGYGWAMRVADAQWFGVPQRRRRVFIVGCLGNFRRAAEVLFERDSLPWNSPPSREAGARVAHCVAAGAGGGKFGTGRDGQDDFVTHTLRAEGHDASEDETYSAVAFQTRIARNGRGQPKEITDALTSADGGTHVDSKPHVTTSMGIRRLTPREAERLQGFSDDWTRFDADGKELSDSARYRMLGNAVCRNVAEWLGRRIIEAAGQRTLIGDDE